MRPYVESIDVQGVADGLDAYRAVEARDPELIARPAGQTDERRASELELVGRFMAAATPEEAMGIWLEAGGGRLITQRAVARATLGLQ
jgi:hypothetical protein